jgi:hypothetical protein
MIKPPCNISVSKVCIGGVRRYQRPDGTLTPEGKKRYDDLDSANARAQEAKSVYKKAKREVNYYRNYGMYDKASEDAYNRASGIYDLRKKQVGDAKARIDMANRTKAPGKREQALIEKYKEKGMNDDEAAVAAYKRAKLEKTLAIVGAVTLTAAAAYGAKKYHDYVTDEVLEVGKVSMKRVASSDTKDLHDTFYAAFSKGDVNKYVGMYGTQMKSAGKKDIYQKTIDLKENIKIASDKNAKGTLGEVLKNTSSQNRDELVKNMEANRNQWVMIGGAKQAAVLTKGINDIKNGKYDTKAAYDAFNIDWNSDKGKVKSEFIAALKNKGYSGIKDRNDASYSGYNANSARIIFDNSKVKVSDVRKVSGEEIAGKNTAEMMKIVGKGAIKLGAAVGGANYAINRASRSAQNNKAINDYRKKHPNTDLTNDEILENYYGGNKK